MSCGGDFMKTLSVMAEYSACAVFGGVVYGALETLARGHTHPSMLITGGVCFAAMYRLDKTRLRFWQKSLLGCGVITSAELCAGVICNMWLGWGVWDYSHLHPNLWGQICLPFSLLWLAITLPAYMLCRVMRRALGRDDVMRSPSPHRSRTLEWARRFFRSRDLS